MSKIANLTIYPNNPTNQPRIHIGRTNRHINLIKINKRDQLKIVFMPLNINLFFLIKIKKRRWWPLKRENDWENGSLDHAYIEWTETMLLYSTF